LTTILCNGGKGKLSLEPWEKTLSHPAAWMFIAADQNEMRCRIELSGSTRISSQLLAAGQTYAKPIFF
jgi:hypothetical protein